MKTMTHLKAAIAKTGYAIDISEDLPNECVNEGTIQIDLDADLGLQFRATNGCSCCAPYWSDCKGSRSEAVEGLLRDIEAGFEPMSDDTKWAQGAS